MASAERRIANDGLPYTYQEFFNHYGHVTQAKWTAAAPLAPSNADASPSNVDGARLSETAAASPLGELEASIVSADASQHGAIVQWSDCPFLTVSLPQKDAALVASGATFRKATSTRGAIDLA